MKALDGFKLLELKSPVDDGRQLDAEEVVPFDGGHFGFDEFDQSIEEADVGDVIIRFQARAA